MSQSHYEAKLPLIQSVPHDATKKPNMPIKRFLQEAEKLFHWCQKDKAALLQVGYDWSQAEDLPALIAALRDAESLWTGERVLLEEAQRKWQAESPKAYALRDNLLRTMRFAYRNDERLLKWVAAITDGNGHADMLQDLNDLAHMGHTYPEPLRAIGFDFAELERAAEWCRSMARLNAEARVERMVPNSARVVRDQAYTLLKNAVDELRANGQFALWDNPERRDGYFSDYHRNARRQGGEDDAPEAEAALPLA